MNDWYKPARELTAEEMYSPWIVTSVSDVTTDKVRAFLAASGKNVSDVEALTKAIKLSWIGHLMDWTVPRKNGAVLMDHLVSFVLHNEGAVKCFMSLSPTAQPDCYLARYENKPVIVYGHRCLYLENNKWNFRNDINTRELLPIADFALERLFPSVSKVYIDTMRKLSDVRIVVAVDKDYYDKDMGIIDRLGDSVRPVIVSLGEHNAEKKKVINELSAYREAYILEDESFIPVCIGKTRSVFISNKKELCDVLSSCGVKVVASGCKCPGAIIEVAEGKENEITADAILGRFVCVERSR